MSDSLSLLVENIELLLFRQGLSQRQFCKNTGINPTQFSRYMQKSTHPTTETLDKIAKGFEVSAWELISQPRARGESVEARLSALEARVSAKPSNLIEKLVAVAERAHDEDVENVIRLLEDLIAHYEPAHKKDTA